MRRIASLLLVLASACFGARSAHAAWAESGNAVANNAIFSEHFRATSAGHSSVCPDMRGGLICAYWKDASSTPDSLVIQRLDRLGNRQWSGTTGVAVGPFEGSNGAITVLSDGDAGAWVVYTIDFSGTGFTTGTYAQHYDPDGVPSIAFPGVRVGVSGVGAAFGSPLAAVTPSGKLLVMLLVQGGVGGTDVLRVQRVTQAGALEWTASGTAIGSSTVAADDLNAFRVLADGEGCVGVWIEETNNTGPARLRANRVSSAGDVQWGANGAIAFQNADDDVLMADACWDGTNGLTIAFSATDLVANDRDLFVTRLTTAGVVNASWGTASTAEKVVNDTMTGGTLRSLGLVSDGADGCIVGWVDDRNSQTVGPGGVKFLNDIRAQRYNASGSAQWASTGVAVDASENFQSSLLMATDDAGGAYFSYMTTPRDAAGTDFVDDVVVKRVGPTGATQWTRFHSGATQPATDDGQQTDAMLAPDGAGGVIYAWSTSQGGLNVFANHRSSSGAVFVGSFALTFPNGGETIPSLKTTTITWSSNFGGQVKLEYSINDGSRVTIASVTADDGAFIWLVPALSSSQVRVHLTLLNESPSDQSAAFFSICPTLDNDATFPTISSAPQAVATGDFNEDGILDLAVPTSTGAAVLRGGGAGGVGNGTFPTVTQLAATGAGRDVAVGDLDADGILDVVVAQTAGLAIFRGQGAAGVGNGTFAAVSEITGIGSLARVALADFDDDGTLDIACSATSLDRVTVLFNGGTFGEPGLSFPTTSMVHVTVGNQPEGLAVADFNEDGMPDIAVVSALSDVVSILLGGGPDAATRRTFAAAVNHAVPDAPHDVVTGDFNEDGITDLAVVCDGTGVGGATLRGLGSGSVGNGGFAPNVALKVSAVMVRLATGDFDRDGIADLLFVNPTGSVQVLWGDGASATGDGSFTPGGSQGVGTSPLGLVVADVNEDNLADVVVANSGTNNVSVLRAGCLTAQASGVVVAAPNGGQTLTPGTTTTLSWTRSPGTIAVNVELSRDGGTNWQRLASNLTGNSLAWRVKAPATTAGRVRVTDAWLGNRTDASNSNFTICGVLGGIDSLATTGTSAIPALADVNEDGHLDLLYATPSGLSQRAGTGTGTFGAVVLRAASNLSGRLRIADIDEDGILDVLARSTSGIVLCRGQGSGGVGDGTFAAPVVAAAAGTVVDFGVADLDEDGIADLVVAGADDTLEVWRGNGANGTGTGAFTRISTRSFSGDASSLVLADFNEDGVLDAAVTTQLGTFGLDVALGQGSAGHGNGSFGLFTHHPTGNPAQAAVTGDFDEDGITDIAVVTRPTTSSDAPLPVVLYRGLGAGGVGNGTFATEVTAGTLPHALGLAVADFNRDGRADLVCTTFEVFGPHRGLALLYGLGTGAIGDGSFAPPEFHAGLSTAITPVIGDLDEDGQPDVVYADGSSARIGVLLGACVPTLATMTLGSPVGGEFFQIGTSRTLTWSASSSVPMVNVETSRDGGANWERIAENLTATSYTWEVTAPTSINARVRVSDATRPQVRAASPADFVIYLTPTGAESGTLPSEVSFSTAMPNPSRGPVRFGLELPREAGVVVELFDASGRRVRTLASGSFGAGRHALAWDGRDDEGSPMAPGVYLVRARTTGLDTTRRVIRVK